MSWVETVPSFVTAGLALLAVIVVLFRWLRKVDDNTQATQKLTAAFELFTGKIEERWLDHEKRITTLEAKSGK